MPDQKVSYRLMTPSDVQVTAYVRKNALEWLDLSQGREREQWMPGIRPAFEHMIGTDASGSWVAEIGGLIVGYAQGFVRGDIWFLAQLFVQPDVHGLGVGQELLRRAQDYGRANGARVFSVIASSSPVAQSLYMRSGMFAVGVAYQISGPVEGLCALPEPAGNRKRVVDCSGWNDRVAALDLVGYGAERRQDHAMYQSRWASSFGLTRDGDLAAYGYVDESGRIGPLAAFGPEDQVPLLRMAGDWLAEHDIGEARTLAISLNRTVMQTLLGAGWRIGSWTYFLASEPFGQFDRYHPSGGILL